MQDFANGKPRIDEYSSKTEIEYRRLYVSDAGCKIDTFVRLLANKAKKQDGVPIMPSAWAVANAVYGCDGAKPAVSVSSVSTQTTSP